MGLFLNTHSTGIAMYLRALYRILHFSDAGAYVVLPVVANWATERGAHGYPAAVMYQAILKITKSSITKFLSDSDQMVTTV